MTTNHSSDSPTVLQPFTTQRRRDSKSHAVDEWTPSHQDHVLYEYPTRCIFEYAGLIPTSTLDLAATPQRRSDESHTCSTGVPPSQGVPPQVTPTGTHSTRSPPKSLGEVAKNKKQNKKESKNKKQNKKELKNKKQNKKELENKKQNKNGSRRALPSGRQGVVKSVRSENGVLVALPSGRQGAVKPVPREDVPREDLPSGGRGAVTSVRRGNGTRQTLLSGRLGVVTSGKLDVPHVPMKFIKRNAIHSPMPFTCFTRTLVKLTALALMMVPGRALDYIDNMSRLCGLSSKGPGTTGKGLSHPRRLATHPAKLSARLNHPVDPLKGWNFGELCRLANESNQSAWREHGFRWHDGTHANRSLEDVESHGDQRFNCLQFTYQNSSLPGFIWFGGRFYDVRTNVDTNRVKATCVGTSAEGCYHYTLTEVADPNVKPTGTCTRKALMITLSYPQLPVGQGFLPGIDLDAKQMVDYAEGNGFDVTWMKDFSGTSPGDPLFPSGKNIMTQVQKLARDAKAGDVLWFYFSGHGGQVDDTNGDEADGMDEYILPNDCLRNADRLDWGTYDPKSGVRGITDDWFFKEFVSELPVGVNVFMMFDCCHSGTMMDLPYEIGESDSESSEAGNGRASARPFRLRSVKKGVNVLYLSGCQDNQESGASTVGSVLTKGFLELIGVYGEDLTLGELVKGLREKTSGWQSNNVDLIGHEYQDWDGRIRYSGHDAQSGAARQAPQLSCSRNVVPTTRLSEMLEGREPEVLERSKW